MNVFLIIYRLAWSWVGGRLAPFYIHQMNGVRTLRQQDTSAVGHFGSRGMLPKCLVVRNNDVQSE